jgi:hypothetical protein
VTAIQALARASGAKVAVVKTLLLVISATLRPKRRRIGRIRCHDCPH